MTFRRHAVIFLFILLSLLFLGCKKAECQSNNQCTKQYYTGTCVENKCVFDKNPTYWCGEALCAGKQGNYLEKFCSNNTCITAIPSDKVKLASLVNEQTLAGDKFKITTDFNQPFNTRKDTFTTTLALEQQTPGNTEHTITRIELTGTTKERRTITLAEKDINKPLWGEGTDQTTRIILNIPTSDSDGEFIGIMLKIYYTYVQTTGTQKQSKTNVLQDAYPSLKFVWARPDKPYPCPPTCDQEGPGMQGTCNPTTGFCDYESIPNTCGNTICEPTENKCSCAQDCGPCSGTIGVYSIKGCTADNKCIVTTKQSITPTPQTIFDDRPLGPFHLQNNYHYNNPFNVKTDTFDITSTLYQAQEKTTGVKIETIRLLDGSQQIAELPVNKDLPQISSTINEQLHIPPQAQPETDRNLIVAVWYQYTNNGVTQKGNFQKTIGKVTLLSPE